MQIQNFFQNVFTNLNLLKSHDFGIQQASDKQDNDQQQFDVATASQQSKPAENLRAIKLVTPSFFPSLSSKDFVALHQMMNEISNASKNSKASSSVDLVTQDSQNKANNSESMSIDEIDELLKGYSNQYKNSELGSKERKEAVEQMNSLLQKKADTLYELSEAEGDQTEYETIADQHVAVGGHRYDLSGNETTEDVAQLPEMTAEEIEEQRKAVEQLLEDGVQLSAMKQGLTLGRSDLGFGVAPVMPLSYAGIGNGDMGMMQPLFNSPAEEKAFASEQLDDFIDMLDVEKGLQEKYGDDVKVFYNALDEQWTMAQSGDAMHNSSQIRTGEQALNTLRFDLGKGGAIDSLGRSEIESRLNQRGYSLYG